MPREGGQAGTGTGRTTRRVASRKQESVRKKGKLRVLELSGAGGEKTRIRIFRNDKFFPGGPELRKKESQKKEKGLSSF